MDNTLLGGEKEQDSTERSIPFPTGGEAGIGRSISRREASSLKIISSGILLISKAILSQTKKKTTQFKKIRSIKAEMHITRGGGEKVLQKKKVSLNGTAYNLFQEDCISHSGGFVGEVFEGGKTRVPVLRKLIV